MSSITDKPINNISEDLLNMELYSKALSDFIIQSDTPITIGLQGEWGTGKTSLMATLLEDFQEKDIATSWVNTWEYNMFRGANETTPKVLQAMLTRLEISCKEAGLWDIGDEVSQRVKNVGKFLGKVANQIIAKKVGVDIQKASASGEGISVDIADIKLDIGFIIDKLIMSSGNPYKKVVFFVDDLDRIPPTDAVEVLEALKNIFDIPNCIFVLAIDYDVVVKGLEKKFGPKTEKNEREFRSFFDKIIQVPFTMPVGTYSIEMLLASKLEKLGMQISKNQADVYGRVVRHTTGANPRSLKRYLNSYSLINIVRSQHASDEDKTDDLMLFALLGIQISYPQIFRLLTQDHNYVNWSKSFANKNDINWDEIKEQLKLYEDNELVDELWEQIVWGACQKEPYLKARAFDVLKILNLLRDLFKENLQEEIEKAMEFASITSVDDDAESKQATQKIGNKTIFNGLEQKLEQLKELGMNPDGIESYRIIFNSLIEKSEGKSRYCIRLAKTGSTFNFQLDGGKSKWIIYINNPQKTSSGVGIGVTEESGVVDELYSYILGILGKDKSENLNLGGVYKRKKHHNLGLSSKLADELGLEKYHQLLLHVSNRVIENCDKY